MNDEIVFGWEGIFLSRERPSSVHEFGGASPLGRGVNSIRANHDLT